MSDALAQISKAGVAVCLDDLSRDRLKSGSLAKLIKEDSVVGVTTNPIIFASAISKSDLYRMGGFPLKLIPVLLLILLQQLNKEKNFGILSIEEIYLLRFPALLRDYPQ